MDQLLSMPGFRFHPTDVELINYFLKRKASSRLPTVEAITDIDLYKYEPWDLPRKSCLGSRDSQWYFFSRRAKKYRNGQRKDRSTKAGHWRISGSDKKICSVSQKTGIKRLIGMKKTLVYHTGRAPHGNRTNWVMHEFRLEDKLLDMSAAIQDSYVICRVFKKSGAGPKRAEEYGASFREEDWNKEISAEDGAAISLEKDSIACDPNNSTLSHANSNVTTFPGVALELDNGVIILDKKYTPTDENIDSLQGCFFELNDLANPLQLDSFPQETHGNSWDGSDGSDDYVIPSMAWYQSEMVNNNAGSAFISLDEYRSNEVATITPTSQYVNCMLLEGDNSEIELLTRPRAEYSGTPFWTEGQLTNPTSLTACMDCLDVVI